MTDDELRVLLQQSENEATNFRTQLRALYFEEDGDSDMWLKFSRVEYRDEQGNDQHFRPQNIKIHKPGGDFVYDEVDIGPFLIDD